MEALKIYEGVLRELDRFGSPRYDVDDHNYFVNKAKDAIVEELVKLYELDQRMTEMLQGIVKQGEVIFNANDRSEIRIGNLPPDFDSLKSCRVTFSIKDSFSCFKKGDKVMLPARRLTEDAEMFTLTNSFYWPSFTNENIFYQTREKKIEIFYDVPQKKEPKVVVFKVNFEYTVSAPDIILSKTFTNVQNSTLHQKVNRKIIERTALLFLENSKNPRTNSYSQINS